jgi:hypothetical protein
LAQAGALPPHGRQVRWRQTDVAAADFLVLYRGSSPGSPYNHGQVSWLGPPKSSSSSRSASRPRSHSKPLSSSLFYCRSSLAFSLLMPPNSSCPAPLRRHPAQHLGAPVRVKFQAEISPRLLPRASLRSSALLPCFGGTPSSRSASVIAAQWRIRRLGRHALTHSSTHLNLNRILSLITDCAVQTD